MKVYHQANRIAQYRAEAQASYNEAQIAIQRFNAENQAKLTQSQINQINSAIAKMNQDIAESKTRQTTMIWQQVNNSSQNVVRLVDALIPF